MRLWLSLATGAPLLDVSVVGFMAVPENGHLLMRIPSSSVLPVKKQIYDDNASTRHYIR